MKVLFALLPIVASVVLVRGDVGPAGPIIAPTGSIDPLNTNNINNGAGYQIIDPHSFTEDFHSMIPYCNDVARAWVRTLFHDAATFDMNDFSGGIDGSIQFELDRIENRGMEQTIAFYRTIVQNRGVSMADTVAYAGLQAIQVCSPGCGPIPFRPGRMDAQFPNPPNRIPNPRLSDNEILQYFWQRMGFTLDETVAIIGGGHSIAEFHRKNNPEYPEIIPGYFDPTPNVLDNAWFVLLWNNPAGARVPSDANMMRNPRMAEVIRVYAFEPRAFFQDFAIGMRRLANLGARYVDGYVDPEDYRNLREYGTVDKANGTSAASSPNFKQPTTGLSLAGQATTILSTIGSAWMLSSLVAL